MPKYKAIYARTETRTMFIYCEAENEEQADEKFHQFIDDSTEIDYDEMECIHAEDYVQSVELCK